MTNRLFGSARFHKTLEVTFTISDNPKFAERLQGIFDTEKTKKIKLKIIEKHPLTEKSWV